MPHDSLKRALLLDPLRAGRALFAPRPGDDADDDSPLVPPASMAGLDYETRVLLHIFDHGRLAVDGDEEEFEPVLGPETPPGCPAPGPYRRPEVVEVSHDFLGGIRRSYGLVGSHPDRESAALGRRADVREWIERLSIGTLTVEDRR